MAILFITSTHIGDAIISSGLLAYLLKRYPHDRITIACGAPAAKVFQQVPRLNTIHVVRKKKHHLHWLELWAKVAPHPWRVVVDLRRSLLPAGLFALKRYSLPKSRKPIHRVELISQTLRLPPQDPVVWTNAEHQTRAATFLRNHRNLIALAPGASWRGKTWPSQRFAELAQHLTANDGLLPDAKIVLVGADPERETGDPVKAVMGSDNVVDAFGVDVLTTYEILRRCRLMVGNDSAMMHLSAAAAIPTVGLFGPTKDEHYAPWGRNGLVVRTPESVADLTEWPGYDNTTTGSLMMGLTVDDVVSAIDKRWQGFARTRPAVSTDPEEPEDQRSAS